MVVMSAYCKAADDSSESEETDILNEREALLVDLLEQAFEKRILSRRRDPDVSRHRPGEVSQTRASVAAEGYSGVDGSRLKVLYSKMRRVYPRYQKPNRSAWHHK